MDTISNMLSAVLNGLARNRAEILIPFSKFKLKLAEILVNEGFFISAQKQEIENKSFIKIEPKYLNRKPVISGMKRISKPGRRIYLKRNELREAFSGMGVTVVSTSSGVKTIAEARRQGLGGEIICQVW